MLAPICLEKDGNLRYQGAIVHLSKVCGDQVKKPSDVFRGYR
jgi:hypothetical protein